MIQTENRRESEEINKKDKWRTSGSFGVMGVRYDIDSSRRARSSLADSSTSCIKRSQLVSRANVGDGQSSL